MAVIESDWPSEISLEIVTPLAYLRTQASALSQLTKGLVEAQVTSERKLDEYEEYDEIDGEYVEHSLTLIAPALDDAEVELLSVTHGVNLVYPCWVDAPGIPALNNRTGSAVQQNTFEDLRKAVRTVLRAPLTTGRIQSLIARINETTSGKSD